MLNEPVRLTSVPLDVRRNGGDNFEVITPAEAKRRYMEIYRRNHPAPKPVPIVRAEKPKPVLRLVPPEPVEAAPAIAEEGAPAADPNRVRDWLIIDTKPKIANVLKETADHYGVTVADIISARRTAKIMKPRQMAMYIARFVTLRSLPEIGRRMGDRDHTTILHGIRRIEGMIEAGDEELSADVAAIRKRLGFVS